MDWKKHYQENLITAPQATDLIKSGDNIVFGHAVGEPSALIEQIAADHHKYKGVNVIHMVLMGKGPHCAPELSENFHLNNLFLGGAARKAVQEGRGDFTPCYFSEGPAMFRDGIIPVDIAFIMVSPPDKHGYVSLGVSVDYTLQAAKSAKLVVAQVNDQMPRTLGDTFLHVSEIDKFVEISAPIIELKSAELTDVERAIGKNCAELIPDGATLQLGIGSLPDAVLQCLYDKKDLGIHSEMFSDGVLDLVEAGVINNSKKTLHPGKMVVTFLMGTRRLYDYVDDNPAVYMAPVDYVNDPEVIAQNDNMISINSCVQVDLMGQVSSESIGLRQISGVGGQVDFVRGANRSKGGKAIIAITSTVGGGKASRIVPFLDEGSAVTTNRCDVRYVVTEYGVADLYGKTLRERGRELIKIAHPDFRPGLIEEWERRFHAKFQ